jgi:hypothetical protein
MMQDAFILFFSLAWLFSLTQPISTVFFDAALVVYFVLLSLFLPPVLFRLRISVWHQRGQEASQAPAVVAA